MRQQTRPLKEPAEKVVQGHPTGDAQGRSLRGRSCRQWQSSNISAQVRRRRRAILPPSGRPPHPSHGNLTRRLAVSPWAPIPAGGFYYLTPRSTVSAGRRCCSRRRWR
jgi:hypothetical protein